MAKYYLYTVIIYVLLTQYQYSICKCPCHRQHQFIRHPKRIEIRGTLKLMCVWAHFCVHLHVFFSKLLQSSCNLIQLHSNCQLLNNGIVCVCVCVLVKVTLESTICSVSCLLRLPLNLEEKCVNWRPSEHLMAQLACLLCECVRSSSSSRLRLNVFSSEDKSYTIITLHIFP